MRSASPSKKTPEEVFARLERPSFQCKVVQLLVAGEAQGGVHSCRSVRRQDDIEHCRQQSRPSCGITRVYELASRASCQEQQQICWMFCKFRAFSFFKFCHVTLSRAVPCHNTSCQESCSGAAPLSVECDPRRQQKKDTRGGVCTLGLRVATGGEG